MLFYYSCKYVLDFYIVLFLSMRSQSSLCLIKFLIFCTTAHLYSMNTVSDHMYKQKTLSSSPRPSPHVYVLFGNGRQVDKTLHWWQRFNLASCPASLPLPQAARGADAEPAVAASFANDPFVVVDVGHASHRYDAGLQYLWEFINMAAVKKKKKTRFQIYLFFEFFNKS